MNKLDKLQKAFDELPKGEWKQLQFELSEPKWICYDCGSDGPFQEEFYLVGDSDIMCCKCMSLDTGPDEEVSSDC